ncbi:DNA cytosine methyltransferase [Streptococcus urinalis]|nr:DNA cytosine methyltransferase [Streptococcus urinalis]
MAGITCFGYYVDEIQTGIDKGQFTDMEVTYITEDTNQLWEEVAPTLSK